MPEEFEAFDRVTAKQAKVPVDKAQSDNFSVAHGPDFETDGKITQPVHFELQSTDNEDMVLSIGKAHVADLGGSRGEAFAKNLVDIVRTLCFGMKLDVLLRLNEHENWGGCIMHGPENRDDVPHLAQQGHASLS